MLEPENVLLPRTVSGRVQLSLSLMSRPIHMPRHCPTASQAQGAPRSLPVIYETVRKQTPLQWLWTIDA